ncbi:7,8-dihydro-8-oxoguanine triphosphatase-like [Thraustotheca clavata]|uniref:Oxidized purine nucleoside triphosphate hydrolase n=1 Tax=Thraustotheca clavata TaxID=74557 RepID=A0A1V9ZQ78_9STRA|nr:7,8-dihydro-8-oxoguanine triphosphatase-like [Thraustotheca clavata]
MSATQHVASTLQNAVIIKHYTLAFLTRDQNGCNEVLLGMKKRGFGAGKWNGFGGKVEPSDPTVADAAAREMTEEANITVHGSDMQDKGTLVFTFTGKPEVMHVHVYQVTKYSGIPTETEEMRPQWYQYSAIPYSSMWSDDKYWLPSLLEGHKIIGQFDFDSDEAKIHHYVLDTIEH